MPRIAFVLFAFLGLTSCANIASLEGGKKDTEPPRIDSSAAFTPNFQTNFQGKYLVLPFDEWVTLNNVLTQVVVSPPLENPIEMRLKKRTVLVDFSKETLRPNTTYTVNFGEAIKDLNEGNFDKNFRYVFSTGAVIDSLSLRGTLIDALTEAPIKEALVLLYDNLADSVVRKERPYYFARTDENGNFSLSYLKRDTFKIFALKDENANYKYDLPNEQIAFLEQPVSLSDSNAAPVLRFFKELQPLKAARPRSTRYGYLPMVFNSDRLETVRLNLLNAPDNLETLLYADADTLKFWYKNTTLDTLKFTLTDARALRDTLAIKLIAPNGKGEKLKPKVKISPAPTALRPDKPLEIAFNAPIVRLDTARILLLEDTTFKVVSPKISTDTLLPHVLKIDYKWKENTPYSLLLPDSTIFDFLGFTNDSLRFGYNVRERKAFGSITATATGLNPDDAYIIEVLTAENQVVERFFAQGKTTASQQFFALDPKAYKLRLILDENKNQRWDAGEYPNRLPEKIVMAKETTELRANWELDLKIELTF